jgi:uncharacterized protein YdeI (YjbR/CyaY-like superfamily)
MKPTYFTSPSALRRWFEANHATMRELWVGFYKKDSGKPTVTTFKSKARACRKKQE